MKKNLGIWLAVSAVLLLLLPWAAVTYVPRQAGFLVCLFLLYVVNPVYFLTTGVWAGRKLERGQNALAAVAFGALLYAAGEGWIWEMGNFSVGYTLAYLILGCLAVGFCRWKLPKWAIGAAAAGAVILCLTLSAVPGRTWSIPALSGLTALDEGALNSRLQGFDIQQLEMTWGPAAWSGESQAVWEIDENTLLYVSLKPDGTAVAFSFGKK